MANHITAIKKEKILLPLLLKELREIKSYLKKLLLIFPEESLKGYKNASEIKKAHLNALKIFPLSKNDH